MKATKDTSLDASKEINALYIGSIKAKLSILDN